MGKTREKIGENIRKYRMIRGIKQKDLAGMLGVNASAVSNWETGVNSIDIEMLVKISEILKVSLDALYGVAESEETFFQKYSMLNSEGRRRAELYIDDLLLLKKYHHAEEETEETASGEHRE